jgi:hypothetical protein
MRIQSIQTYSYYSLHSSSPPTTVQTVVIDPELVNAVQEITIAIANATAAGKELTLTAEQQAILQKHQQLVNLFSLFICLFYFKIKFFT